MRHGACCCQQHCRCIRQEALLLWTRLALWHQCVSFQPTGPVVVLPPGSCTLLMPMQALRAPPSAHARACGIICLAGLCPRSIILRSAEPMSASLSSRQLLTYPMLYSRCGGSHHLTAFQCPAPLMAGLSSTPSRIAAHTFVRKTGFDLLLSVRRHPTGGSRAAIGTQIWIRTPAPAVTHQCPAVQGLGSICRHVKAFRHLGHGAIMWSAAVVTSLAHVHLEQALCQKLRIWSAAPWAARHIANIR